MKYCGLLLFKYIDILADIKYLSCLEEKIAKQEGNFVVD